MENYELKDALLNEKPVIAHILGLGDLEYDRVSAVVYRKNRQGSFIISVELIDRNKNSVLIVPAKNIRYKEKENGNS